MTQDKFDASIQLQTEIKRLKEVLELSAKDKAPLVYSYGPVSYTVPQELKQAFIAILESRLQELQSEFDNL